MKTTIFRISALLILMISFLAACTPGEVKGPPDEVTVQLKWIHQAQFAGFYIADKKGFYAEENINVTLNVGGTNISSETMISDLVDGNTDFAIVGGDLLIEARLSGKPVVAIAVIFQRNPRVYVTLKGSGIVNPEDLAGKRIMVPDDGIIQHYTLLRKLGIDEGSIEIIPYERDITPLTTGLIDAHMIYRTGLALAFEEAGYELNFIWVEDYGIHLYADTIITTERMIEENPDLVERFLRATLRGWRYAIENSAEAVDITLQFDATLNRDRQMRMMEVQIPLIHTGKSELGWMDRSVWDEMHDIFLEEEIEIDEVYTMQFLNKIYSKEK